MIIYSLDHLADLTESYRPQINAFLWDLLVRLMIWLHCLPSAAQRSSRSTMSFGDSLQLNEVKDDNNNFMIVLLFPAKYCQA